MASGTGDDVQNRSLTGQIVHRGKRKEAHGGAWGGGGGISPPGMRGCASYWLPRSLNIFLRDTKEPRARSHYVYYVPFTLFVLEHKKNMQYNAVVTVLRRLYVVLHVY